MKSSIHNTSLHIGKSESTKMSKVMTVSSIVDEKCCRLMARGWVKKTPNERKVSMALIATIFQM